MIYQNYLRITILFLVILISACKLFQRPDKKYSYTTTTPFYPTQNGPTVYIDEVHHNEHGMSTGYKPFAEVLKSDGYTVFPFKEIFTKPSLEKVQLLVIVNALNEKNVEEKALPTSSAFSKDEIIAIKEWVANGGSLFLVADHMPYPGAAAELASEFGFKLANSFAMRSKYKAKFSFTKAEQTLHSFEPITNEVDSIVSYFGSAFQPPPNAYNLFSFPKDFKIYLTEKPWRFPKRISVISAENYSQGAVLEYEKGKVAIFGEGAMFTAQYMVFSKSGINSPKAPNNVKFLLNVIHWLSN
jgi:hypothetical protein